MVGPTVDELRSRELKRREWTARRDHLYRDLLGLAEAGADFPEKESAEFKEMSPQVHFELMLKQRKVRARKALDELLLNCIGVSDDPLKMQYATNLLLAAILEKLHEEK